MSYPFENLSPEKFQKFCQAILIKEFPSLQCFPVGQPDGGRDGVQYVYNSSAKEFAVFQIKFVREPNKIESVKDWLAEIIEDEIPKVKRLISKGASRYFFLTNISGSAHLDTGSIDKLQQSLNAKLKVISFCYWRDDLSRRLDGNWDLKWSFPELMTGADFIRLSMELQPNHDRTRRENALKTYFSYVYNVDREVRFKQVELQNKLLDLFVDVPIVLSEKSMKKRDFEIFTFRQRHLVDEIRTLRGEKILSAEDEFALGGGSNLIGAADYLLNASTSEFVPRILLEGAPGQGKSTITQYLCQVHRMRLLQKNADINLLPEHHANSKIRVPFRLDLRDYATWLTGLDPFTPELVPRTQSSTNSVESFLCNQIRHLSGGAEFSVNDLQEIVRVSPLLIVFDGLDEVAELNRRNEILREINAVCARLESVPGQLQVIVTSRPSIFATDVSSKLSDFSCHSLASLDQATVESYAGKWAYAKRLDSFQGAEVKRILKDKIGQSHLRDLARNPMQLAILLSLIHTLGSSLPDKRTALYDKYIDLFFNRESDKSEIVRTQRDLLIDIHRFLAWKLHAEAERGRERGSITAKELRELLKEYLEKEGHDATLVESLFTGMVERVVAIVSRVEGTFEFEVQPLREFFAARHLYETAPYSPPGREQPGTKPDRFDGLARNYYWLNVTRFYAGCFSKGEIPSLVERLRELIGETGYSQISYPRMLAATLLSDWVFTQNPNSIREIVSLIVDDLGLRFLLSSKERSHNRNGIGELPEKCGRYILFNHCFGLLATHPAFDFALDLIELIRQNASGNEIFEKWSSYFHAADTPEKELWLKYGIPLGAAIRLDSESVSKCVETSNQARALLHVLIRAGHGEIVQNNANSFEIIVNGILDGFVRGTRRKVQTSVEAFLVSLESQRYSICFSNGMHVPLREIWEQRGLSTLEQVSDLPNHGGTICTQCKEVVSEANDLSQMSAYEWQSSVEPWKRLVDKAWNLFGDRMQLMELASLATLTTRNFRDCESVDLFNQSVSLVTRAFSARKNSTNSKWWKRQTEGCLAGNNQRKFVLFSLLCWANQSSIFKNIDFIENGLAEMTESEYQAFIMALESVLAPPRSSSQANSRDLSGQSFKSRDAISAYTAIALNCRASNDFAEELFEKSLKNFDGTDSTILKRIQGIAVRKFLSGPVKHEELLDLIARSYQMGLVSEPYSYHHYLRSINGKLIPSRISSRILSSAGTLPSALVGLAESSLSEQVGLSAKPLATLAEEQGWFY